MRSAVIDLSSQPIRNLAVNPSFEFGTNGIGTANGATIARIPAAAVRGLQGIRVTCPANNISDSGVGVSGQVSPLVVGQTYTYSVYLRAVTAGRLCMYLTGRFNGGSSNKIFTPTLAAGEVYRLSGTFVATASTGSGDWWVLREGGATESIFDVDGIMVNEGPLQSYGDGDTPGWRWTGTAHGSVSVGYPLLDFRRMPLIAGPIYSDAGGAAGVWSILQGEVGPTGYPISRILKGPTTGWGAYTAANLPGAVIPAGTKFEISWWQRSSSDSAGANVQFYQVINDSANSTVNTGNSYPRTPQWTKFRLSGTTSVDWVPNTHRFRGAIASNGVPGVDFLDLSDVRLRLP